MRKKLICFVLFLLVLGLAQGQAWGQSRAAYWDGDYGTAWAGGGEGTRDALAAAGYEILDADQLKVWMDAHIPNGKGSVVVFCKDAVPDTVAETMSATCTLRQYLDAGGKIVWQADIPFYYMTTAGSVNTTWGDAGAPAILGFNTSGVARDIGGSTITDEGTEWGITESWGSQRAADPALVDIVLATDSGGNAAAWVKFFVPGDTAGGFVRLRDTGGQANVDDILRVAEYGLGGNPFARGPNPENGAIYTDTWLTISWYAGDDAVSHDVYFSDSFDDVSNGAEAAFRGNQQVANFIIGFPGFPYPDGLVPGTSYYWRVDEVNDTEPNSPWIGPVWNFSIAPKTAYLPDPADGAEFVDPNAVFTWTPGLGGKLHTIYMGTNFDDVSNAAGAMPLGVTSYSPGTLELEKVYYWRVDEFDPPFTHKGDVWGFTTPGAVGNPSPANGAAGVQKVATLSWTAADNATSHELYFGADADAVGSATTASPEYVGPKALGAESYDPGGLAWDSSYAWRMDEVYPTETVKGLVWTFTTADFVSVDDFESYNDIDPPDAASNRIFDKWIDGFGTTTNGALVGNDMPPYAEQTTVHGGSQSMPYLYDNNLKTSEATLTLVYPRDWTEEGVTKLSIMFRGSSGNSPERMFVALGNTTVYHPDPAATQITGWNEWVIDLTAFGVDLTNVPSITIGFGTRNSPAAGDIGTMYFDDIRLIK